MTEPADSSAPPAASRLGMSLFFIYSLLYLAFVLLNAFAADTMDRVVFAGLNLAIVFGFGLILAAIVMAFVYGFALRENGNSRRSSNPQSNGDSA